jgi:PAS domain S-box-containing protein
MNQPDRHPVTNLTPYHSSLRIALIYLCFSVVWIYFGDRLLLTFLADPDALTRFQTYKGLLFVFGSVVLIFFLVKNALSHAARLQQIVRDQEEGFRLLIENQNDLIVKIDPQGHLQFVSPSYCTISGNSEKELLGRSFIPPVQDQNHVTTAEAIESLRRSRGTTYFEQRVLTVDGWRWFGWSGRAITSESDGLIAIIFVGRDISDIRKTLAALHASEKKFRNLFEMSIDAIFIVDKSTGRYLDANLAASRLTGYSISRLKEMTTRELTPTKASNRLKQLDNFQDSMDLGLVTYQRSDGDVRVAQLHTIPVDESRVFGIAHDITALKQAELSLKLKSQEMESFVYMVSHDLKSPLVTIKAFLKMLEQDIKDDNQAMVTQDLEFISGATEKVETLLEALLQLSRIGRVDSQVQSLRVKKLIADCLTALAGPLQQRQVVTAVAEVPHELSGDPLHFGQIWQNLIENAIKYMGDQPRPEVSVGVEYQQDETIFFVCDNGMGIAPEHHQHIFTIFTQLNRASDGTGLGLSLVKKIVELYGGRIWLESQGVGHGSCFKFTLPTALISRAPMTKDTKDQPASNGATRSE